MQTEQANRLDKFVFVAVIACAATGMFLFLIHTFIIDIFLAAIFAGLLTPLFRRAAQLLGGREGVAAGLVVGTALLAVALPLAAITTVVVSEAIQLSSSTVA